ncbi:17197_t:CDS:2 [Cetraspora pellucida]|uniref:17197_t:CDS:1 n=1 Tax=Cetraspora pellucida TaxID=1433469 RepID=A0ACA9M4U5_9GLOM|nr:17197_t:CDS:2 [Cetraspora pellucida]
MSNYLDYLITKNKLPNFEIKTFELEAEGFYPHASELHFTLLPNKYPIPDNYSIKTSWGRGENQQTVQCKIKYKNRSPEFRILYSNSFEHEIKSNKSATKAATDYNKAINTNSNKKSLLSGPLLFGLQLQRLRTMREFRVRQHIIKPTEQYSQSTLRRHAKEIATTIKKEFIQNIIFKYHAQDSVLLKSLEYAVNNQNYYFDFGNENPIQKKIEILNIIKKFGCSKFLLTTL